MNFKYITNFFKNINWPRISIYSITLSGVFLGIIAGSKLLDQFMPKVPLGIAAWEVYITVIALSMIALPFGPAILVLVSAPFIFMAMGFTYLLSPFSFFLDYSFPIFIMILVKFAKNKYFAVLFFVIACVFKYLSHTISGVIFYEVNLPTSLSLNWPYVLITAAITIPIIFVSFESLRNIRKNNSFTKETRWS